MGVVTRETYFAMMFHKSRESEDEQWDTCTQGINLKLTVFFTPLSHNIAKVLDRRETIFSILSINVDVDGDGLYIFSVASRRIVCYSLLLGTVKTRSTTVSSTISSNSYKTQNFSPIFSWVAVTRQNIGWHWWYLRSWDMGRTGDRHCLNRMLAVHWGFFTDRLRGRSTVWRKGKC